VQEVAVEPLPPLRSRIHDLDPDLEQILLIALQRDRTRRWTAAAMGRALDDWLAAQHIATSPDRLQAHLAQIFPATYQPPTRADDEPTSFSNLRAAMTPAPRSLLSRIFRG
jgi:hypothetical protein